MKVRLLFAALAALPLACQLVEVECDRECLDNWLDGRPDDTTLTDSSFRISTRIPHPTAEDLAKPVVLAVHGFTASTYEWKEYWTWVDSVNRDDSLQGNPRPPVLVSLVLMGGHGRDIGDFQSSTWQQWGAPILAEYDALVAKGYKNISLVGASTACALFMEYLGAGEFHRRQAPHWIYLIDPIVVPTAKLLSLVNLVGPILGNSPDPGTATEKRYWYVNRPAETLAQLYELINRVKNRLEDGFELPAGSRAKVFKSKKDGEADPVSALLIYKGMRRSGGSHILAEMVDSRKHVFTRLAGRSGFPNLPAADRALQTRVFLEMTDSFRSP